MPAIVFGNATKPSPFAHFWQDRQSLAPATQNDIWSSKSGANMWCLFLTFWLRNVLRASSRRNGVHFFDISTSKSGPNVCVLCILTWKCASRHNGVHFFDISTSKGGPTLRCFVHFVLEMCFAPQWRALFRHRNFQKWSDAEVFCTFWLGNVLRPTTAWNFSSLIWPAGSAPAALASLLFSTLRSLKSLEKDSVSRLSYLFAHLHLLSSDSFSSTLLSSNLFPSLCLCPAVGLQKTCASCCAFVHNARWNTCQLV